MHDVGIVGGGISGLALAWNLIQLRPDLNIVVLDKSTRVGGCVRTLERGGYRVELGPNGVVDRDPYTLDLIRAVGLGDDLIRSSDASRKRYLYLGGDLVALPESPPALFRSESLSMGAKARLLCEPLIPARRKGEEESIAAFARRRLGSQVAERFLDPFVSGVYAGDPEKISVKAAFPKVFAMEQESGSLFRAVLKRKKRVSKKEGEKADPIGTLWSLRGGMGALTQRLGERLGRDRLMVGARVRELERFGPGWRIYCQKGMAPILARHLVLSTPARISGKLLVHHCSDLGEILKEWPYAGIVVVALTFRREAVTHPLDAFGYLVPSLEDRPILGCLFSSSVYPGERSPDNHILLRVMMGGARHPELLDMGADSLVKCAKDEVAQTLGIDEEPTMSQVIRWADALPQYQIGHHERVERAEALLREYCKGITLHSNAYYGVAVNDCARRSLEVAKNLAANLSRS